MVLTKQLDELCDMFDTMEGGAAAAEGATPFSELLRSALGREAELQQSVSPSTRSCARRVPTADAGVMQLRAARQKESTLAAYLEEYKRRSEDKVAALQRSLAEAEAEAEALDTTVAAAQKLLATAVAQPGAAPLAGWLSEARAFLRAVQGA